MCQVSLRVRVRPLTIPKLYQSYGWFVVLEVVTRTAGRSIHSYNRSVVVPSPVAVLDTSYGAAWVWMWNQRERSLTPPCSLMALIR